MTKIAFLNDNGELVHISNSFCSGTIDILKHSTLTPVLIQDDGKKVVAESTTYEIGDVVFVHHHMKQFKFIGYHHAIRAGKAIKLPKFVELNPTNPKFPIEILSLCGNYPKVINENLKSQKHTTNSPESSSVKDLVLFHLEKDFNDRGDSVLEQMGLSCFVDVATPQKEEKLPFENYVASTPLAQTEKAVMEGRDIMKNQKNRYKWRRESFTFDN